MNILQVFENDNLRSNIRTVIINHEPWFAVKDVCDALDIKNARDAITDLDDDEKQLFTTSNVGLTDIRIPNRGLQCVSESGLYLLIFKSRKPEAKAFCKWVTKIVLPAIRKTGSFGKDLPREQRYLNLMYRLIELKMHPVNAAKWAMKAIEFGPEEYDEENLSILNTYKSLGIDKINSKRLITRWSKDVRAAQNQRFEKLQNISDHTIT